MKLILEVNLPDFTIRDLKEKRSDWFPFNDDRISIDRALLEQDPGDDDFYLFRYVHAKEDE